PGRDGAPAAEGGGGEGEDGAVVDDVDGHQPAVHHRDAGGPEAPERDAVACEVRAARRRPDPADDGADGAGVEGCGAQGERRGRGDPGRRLDADPEGAGGGAELLRQGSAQGREPGRGRGDRKSTRLNSSHVKISYA